MNSEGVIGWAVMGEASGLDQAQPPPKCSAASCTGLPQLLLSPFPASQCHAEL